MLDIDDISVRQVIGILTTQQAYVVGLCSIRISVTVDANALQNAILTTLW